MIFTRVLAFVFVTYAVVGCSPVDDPTLYLAFDADNAIKPREMPLIPKNPQRNLLWGDTHIHTSLSTDAHVMGVRALPDDAYVYARGGEIEHGAGYGIHLRKPLDFAAVTDHSEYLGVMREIDPELPLSSRSLRQRLIEDSPLRTTIAWIRTMVIFNPRLGEIKDSDKMSATAWKSIIESAERNYQPGRFTTFIGYEWSSMPEKNNLHRVVLYKGSSAPDIPFSSLDSQDPRDLWTQLEKQRAEGMDNIAIPHNGNVSGGLMYGPNAFDGTPIDSDYAERRMRNEPVSEIFQVKGQSETHPELSPEDGFADFEIFDTILSGKIRYAEPKGGYARDALRLGIEMSHNEGFNPYRFGVIGSTDTHNAASPVEEDNYFGKLPLFDGSAGIRMGENVILPEDYQLARRWGASGLAAVWAEENTRESIFDAIRRKESYATSGPRITVRFFGGWNYPEDILQASDPIDVAEKTGVPMGGSLPKTMSAKEGAPTFVVWALKDPDSANLDRIQIIKGWVDESGKSQEKIYDVALSDSRKPNPKTGQVPDVGNTVNIEEATYENSIGDVQLSSLWTDPDFSPDSTAFYYARVIEIPTPRWTTYDSAKLGIAAPEPTTIQERAVTSAIWYEPQRDSEKL
ncbi:DUF3604 domain-containing protein [Zhongshania aquimaris]|uniref:DUF3604 domain-containing protein n=1 Tax=Zhongshania aquimaris TaxID=2857107 RepID=A0ABS6VSN2_9GAMM|nr:DUF3604 domain-containing protein [Zhongshania aquimaris]MBW2941328.1 DUF3604 domain-containing protein [Zhongshania aquimaris]